LAKSSEQTAAPETPSTLFNTLSQSPIPANSEATAQPCRSMRTDKPLYIKHDSQSEEVVHSGTNAPHLAPSLHVPSAFLEDPDEAGGVTTEEGSVPKPLEDLNNTESAFAAETADANVPNPHMLAEATRSPDWLPREKSIEEKLDTCKARPVAQIFSQTGGVDAHMICDTKVAHVAANSRHVHWGAIKRILCYFSGTPDPPFTHVETSSPLEGLSDTTGNIAKDRRAISEHTFPIDGGTAYQSSKWQDNALSPTIRSGHITVTHSGKQAS